MQHYRRLFAYVRPYLWPRAVAAIACMLTASALEGTVPYHEGMHAISTPIAGLEGTEGGALNEGQADVFALTITDNESLGDYVVNAYRLRQDFRDAGRDPDSLGYIRSARSTNKYSDIGTRIIARESGFGRLDRMSKVFSRLLGMGPKEYRARHRRGLSLASA